jgi:phosphohistidine phosphatase SixA
MIFEESRKFCHACMLLLFSTCRSKTRLLGRGFSSNVLRFHTVLRSHTRRCRRVVKIIAHQFKRIKDGAMMEGDLLMNGVSQNGIGRS